MTTILKGMLRKIWERLRKPSVVISLTSQVGALLILLGYSIDEQALLTVVAALCSILATLGIMSSSETKLLRCSACGTPEPHVEVNDRLVCQTCGAVYAPPAAEGK